uniref:Uncharacterized protein n=1 Tax=Sphaerodactylus townsendi TaxID=933632 RepID=A0ACB8F726_9SAUR
MRLFPQLYLTLRSLRSILGRGRAQVLPLNFEEVAAVPASADPADIRQDPASVIIKHLRGSQQPDSSQFHQKPLTSLRAIIQHSEAQHWRARTTLQLACTKDEMAAQVRVSEAKETLLRAGDPEQEIRGRIREAISWLYVLLLHQRGEKGVQGGNEGELCWKGPPSLTIWCLPARAHRQRCPPPLAPGRAAVLEKQVHQCHSCGRGSGKATAKDSAYGPHLSPAQETEYLKASWGMVGRLDREWVRMGGLFLLHSPLGQAYHIMEAEEEVRNPVDLTSE